jgi:hypothetical protein
MEAIRGAANILTMWCVGVRNRKAGGLLWSGLVLAQVPGQLKEDGRQPYRQEIRGWRVDGDDSAVKKSFQSEVAGASKKLTPVGLADVEPTCPSCASELAQCPLRA